MLELWLWLYSQPGIGSKQIIALRRYFGEDLDLEEAERYLKRRLPQRHEKILSQLSKIDAEVIPFWDSRYPELLKKIPDFPAFLFYKGLWDAELLEKSVSIVGTRRMSEYGRSAVQELVGPLVASDTPIVSGLAMGIDAETHLELLRSPKSKAFPVAILPGGPEKGFPATNCDLYQQILQDGVVIWEHLPGTSLSKGMFASRNRVVAGLSCCTVVAEAPIKSGAMITAELALQYNRDVCAVPGSIFQPNSEGTNQLIRQGAHLVRDGYDVLKAMAPGQKVFNCNKSDLNDVIVTSFVNLLGVGKPCAQALFRILRAEGIGVDEISKYVNLDVVEIRRALTKLEVEGILSLDLDGKVKLARS